MPINARFKARELAFVTAHADLRLLLVAASPDSALDAPALIAARATGSGTRCRSSTSRRPASGARSATAASRSSTGTTATPPDRRYGEVPAAFVQLHPGARVEADDLIAHCLDAIATYKVPRYVRFVDEWPMSGTKIQKFRLRERLAHELADAGVDQAPKPRERGLGRSR